MLDNLSLIFQKIMDSEGCEKPEKPGLISFVNPYSAIKLAQTNALDLSKIDFLYSDGFLLTWLMKVFFNTQITRRSFDASSIALDVLSSNNTAIIGGSSSELKNFEATLYSQHRIEVTLISHGYLEWNEQDIVRVNKKIIESNADVIILGLGCPLQEKVGLKLKAMNPNIIVYTCGAFITQTSYSHTVNYYPYLVNKFNLRWAYRLIKEPHTFSRLKFVLLILYYAVLIRFSYDK